MKLYCNIDAWVDSGHFPQKQMTFFSLFKMKASIHPFNPIEGAL